MLDALKTILEIQEMDMQMIRLVRLKRERQRELKKLFRIRQDLGNQVSLKESQVLEIKKDVKLLELEIAEVKEKIAKLETQQNSIKKVEEFNALNHEISTLEKQRHGKEQALSDLFDKLAAEEELLKGLTDSLGESDASTKELEKEIYDSIGEINQEGRAIKAERERVALSADADILPIYERLLRNKASRVVVPIENRACSGCHIQLTAQDENLVRKGERLIFCEHCSRIHYWPETEVVEEGEAAPKRRRRAAKT